MTARESIRTEMRRTGVRPDNRRFRVGEGIVIILCRHALRCLAVFVAAALSTLPPPRAAAQEYPRRAVKVIVPFPAGGSADLMPRAVFDVLSRKWGQPVVIEN